MRIWPAVLVMLTSAIAFQARAQDCAALASTTPPGAVIRSAERVAAGPMTLTPGAPASSVTLPSFCRVKGVAAGAIGYEVWLPETGWNGRLLSLGNGGFGGAIPLAPMAEGLAQGYAVTANDTGHQGDDRAWMRDRAKVRLWGHSATHLVTAPAKAAVHAYYGQPARYAYFSGCSTGGAQAMEEAEFYPQDYDGIVAGAPGMSYTRLMLSFLWGLKAADRPGGALSLEKLERLHEGVLKACDAGDGVKDGLISDPLACRFDPGVLVCKAGDGPDCLTPAQVETARLIYQGPRNPRTGAALYPGFAFGSEADPVTNAKSPFAYGWMGIQGPLAQMFAIPLLREMVYHDPQWDWRRFDWDHDVVDLDHRISADITAVDPDLRPFARRKGRLIIYQGWGDPLNAQTLPIQYRGQVINVFAKSADKRTATRTVDGFLKVFMAPGMGHCTGGPGPNKIDALSAVRAWVERGEPPRQLIAMRAPGDAKPMSRPLCPYPQVARWTGRGDPDTADTFVCKANPS